MALASKVHEGLAILLKYDPDAECDAQHDVLHVFGSPNKLENITAKDRADLEGLGWFLDDMEESWSHFTKQFAGKPNCFSVGMKANKALDTPFS